MRAAVITRHGGPEVLEVRELPERAPGPGEVAIRVAAAGVNFADLMARVGLYGDAPSLPAVVGYEVAGTVEALGPGVEGVAEGDRVMAGTRFGGYAERVVVGARDVVALPARLDFAQGAAVPVNYATAYAAVVEYGSLRRDQRVLIHAAAGGVGIAATQLARALGAQVWGSASPGKHAALIAHGVDQPVDYTAARWWKGLPSFDLVLDAIGGRSFRRSYALLRPGGRLVAYGASSTMRGERRDLRAAARAVLTTPRLHLLRQMSESKTVVGLNMLRLWDERGSLDAWIDPLRERLADGTITPVVAARFPLEAAGEAHRYLGERRNVGKVVLEP